MKYFRKHPELLLIANYPQGGHRVRHGRQTTTEDVSKIIVHTISAALGSTKKILLLTDAPEELSRRPFITKTSWSTTNPLSIGQLVNGLLYNHQAHTVCCIYHPDLFGNVWTAIFTPPLLTALRFSGKRVLLIMINAPKSSIYPTLKQTFAYWLSILYRCVLTVLSTTTIVSEKPLAKTLRRRTGKRSVVVLPMTFRSLKERKIAGNILREELFPSPIKDLGLIHYLHPDARTKPAT